MPIVLFISTYTRTTTTTTTISTITSTTTITQPTPVTVSVDIMMCKGRQLVLGILVGSVDVDYLPWCIYLCAERITKFQENEHKQLI